METVISCNNHSIGRERNWQFTTIIGIDYYLLRRGHYPKFQKGKTEDIFKTNAVI